MTITRKPASPIKATRAKKATPETFIEEGAAHPAAPKGRKTAKTATKPPVEATQAAAVPAIETADAAAPVKKAKDKEKIKDKAKDRAKDKGKEKKHKKDKEAVLIRFDDDQLVLMDERAATLGLSRAAWLRMVVAKALMAKK